MSGGSTAEGIGRHQRIAWMVALTVLLVILGRQVVFRELGLRGIVHSDLDGNRAGGGEGPSAPLDFTLQDLSGREVALSQYHGQVVLLNFWATWCPPCREELPLLEDYYLAHADQGFVLIGVNVSDRPEAVAGFVEEGDYRFPIWLDPPGNVLMELGLNGLPASLLLDREGQVRQTWIGPLTEEILAQEVTPLLEH